MKQIVVSLSAALLSTFVLLIVLLMLGIGHEKQ